MLKVLPSLFLPFLLLVADWPQYHGPLFNKSTKTSIIEGNKLQTSSQLIWKSPTPLGFSSFSIHSDLAFTLVAEEDPDGLLREVCIALDLASGKRTWQQNLGIASYGHAGGNAGTRDNSGGDGPRSTPSVKNGRIFVYDSSMVLHCLSAKSGKRIWKVDVIDDHKGENIMWKNASSPLLVDDLVIVCGGGKNQSLIAFNQMTGRVKWKTGTETLTHATPAFAKIHGLEQVIFLCRSGLVALEPKNGKELWRQEFPFKVSTASSPVVADDLVFCSAGYGVGAGVFKISLNAGNWKSDPVWRKRNELMNHWSTPLYYEGNLYGIFGFKEYGKAPLQCVDLNTGEIHWSQNGFGPGNLIRSGDTLWVLSDDGQLVAVSANPTRYKELGRSKIISGKCWTTPTMSKNILLARSTKEAAALFFGKK
jgi:outer membrane protein assembly factor BamB